MKRFIPLKIKQRRKVMGLSQVELARLCRISNIALCCIERGRKTPRTDTLLRISNVLGTDLDYFFIDSTN